MSVNPSAPPPKGPAALDFKSASLYALRVVLHSHASDELEQALNKRMSEAGSLFENEPVVIDASKISSSPDWPALIQMLKDHRLHPIGVVAEGRLLEQAGAAGLAPVDLSSAPVRPAAPTVPDHEVPAVAVPAAGTSLPTAQAAPTTEAGQPEIAPAAMVINRQLRSGQRVYARNTDLIVIGVVGQGAEVIADGNIHIYGPLRGKAMAGARGDTSARIYTTGLDPELIAIAGVYRVVETRLDDKLHNQPAYVQLNGDSLDIVPLDNRRP